jgi:uncharacterized protein YwgA
MQELGGVPLKYRFHFYHYGPYSSDLAGDLEFVNTLKGISIDYNLSLNNMVSRRERRQMHLFLKHKILLKITKKG